MLKVLVVEDEQLMRRGLICVVDWEKFGCSVVGEASNGEKGVELIRRMRPDVVITDINMPVLSGLEMLSETIDEIGYEAIIISGYENFAYAKAAIKLGVAEYLLKPLKAEEVETAMKKVVARVEQKKKAKRLEFGQIQDRRRILDVEAVEAAMPEDASYARAMVNFIKENHREKISVTDLSRKLMINTAPLHKKFKDATNYTFHEFLNRYRIQRAVLLLLTTERKAYEIAAETGFADYKYFTQVFKKYVGYSPMEFVAKTVEGRLYL